MLRKLILDKWKASKTFYVLYDKVFTFFCIEGTKPIIWIS